jgi:DNA polymerase epsilon subunit 2
MAVVSKVDKLVLDRLRLEGLAVQSDAATFLCKFLRSQDNAQEVLDEIIASIPKNSLSSSHVDIDVFRVAIESISRDDTEVLKNHVLRVLTLEQYPLMEYHPARKTYLRATKPLNLHADADAKILLYRNRLASIRQRLSRKDTFSLPILQQLAGKREYFQLTSIDSLLGGAGEKTVLGLLTQIQDGKWFLEDERSYVQLDLSDALMTPGFFTENSIVIAQGDLQNDIFSVKVLGMPPAENRKETEFSFPALDFFGEAPPSKLVPRLTEYEKQRHMLVVLSEVWLDDPAVLGHLRTLFSGFEQYVPKAFIFLGSFFSRPFGKKADDSVTYRACFDALADLITSFKPLASQCEFIFIPGPNDPGPAVLPRMPLPRVFTSQLRERLGKRVHLRRTPVACGTARRSWYSTATICCR